MRRQKRRQSNRYASFLQLWGIFLLFHGTHGKKIMGLLEFPPPKTKLTWVNGIGYNASHMEREAPFISDCFGGKTVHFYHNPTKMIHEQDAKGYFSDLTQAGQQKYLGRITEEVNGLAKHLKEALLSAETVVHICHSQGALVTFLAAKQLTMDEMKRIEVLSFGGATPVQSSKTTPFKRCVNYYSVNDPLLFLNPSAETALRSGYCAQDDFCFLAPRIGDPIADHMLLGPTYASALQWEGRRFQIKYQGRLKRSVRCTRLWVTKTVLLILEILRVLYKAILRALERRSILWQERWKNFTAPSLPDASLSSGHFDDAVPKIKSNSTKSILLKWKTPQ